MNNQVCFQSNHFLLVVIACFTMMGWALYQVNQQAQQIHLLTANRQRDLNIDNIENIINQKMKETPQPERITRDDVNNQVSDLLANASRIQREQDYQRINDPLTPPLQRLPFLSPPINMQPIMPINIPTQGDFGNFQDVGYVYHPQNPELMFPLFGRQIYSNKYEYYVIHPYNKIKISIKVKNDWELNKDDAVKIKGFPGDFVVEIYDLDQPRYIPY